ncbi:MAG: hypothetical protein S0880_28930 [Actinomycetota bacterium]|nr:hypothetical protein [Actinomycetota bacterium]
MSTSSDGPTGAVADAWDDVVGQDDLVARLRSSAAEPVHAYLFVGPPGSGRRAAARAFAGDVLAAGSEGDEADRHRALARAESHPDLVVVEREGPFITRDQARWIVNRAAMAPVEGNRKVLVLTEFHLVLDAAPILLKSIEEPPAGTVFVVVADDVPPELVTIASRCVRLDFRAVPTTLVAERLRAEGVEDERADIAAHAAGGDLARARLLATDDELAARLEAWRAVAGRLDGTGATAADLVVELIELVDRALVPLTDRQATELEDLADQEERYGMRRSGRKAVEDRHRRERRRARTDELRTGFAALAGAYRADLVEHGRPGRAMTALAALSDATETLERNPNERLLLQALFVRLSAAT